MCVDTQGGFGQACVHFLEPGIRIIDTAAGCGRIDHGRSRVGIVSRHNGTECNARRCIDASGPQTPAVIDPTFPL